MITIKMWGGLGNQMFQYAFGYALKEIKRENVLYDIDFYSNQPQSVGKRRITITNYFELLDFDTGKRSFEQKIMGNRYINRGIRIFPISHFYLPRHTLFIKEKKRTYMETLPYKEGWNNYYDGYWLTEKYFLEYRENIKQQYTLKPEVRAKVEELNIDIEGMNSVSVHIRRGDYLVNNNMPSGYTIESLLAYYDRAIDYAQNCLNNPTFYFFSDDIEWCKNHFSGIKKARYVDRKSQYAEIADLIGISKCKHGIMSPSTFSWWGNWLREDGKDSLVIYPAGKYANDHFGCDEWMPL